jgi:hypothetical protein
LVARRVIERRVHQDAICTVRQDADRRKIGGARCDIERDRPSPEPVCREIGPREIDQGFVPLDQYEIDPIDARRDSEARRADASTKIDDTLARLCRRRGRKQHRIVTGAMTALRLPQPEPATKKTVFAD